MDHASTLTLDKPIFQKRKNENEVKKKKLFSIDQEYFIPTEDEINFYIDNTLTFSDETNSVPPSYNDDNITKTIQHSSNVPHMSQIEKKYDF